MHCSGFNFIKLVNKSIYFQSHSDKTGISTRIIRIEIIILVITLPFDIYFLSFSFAWVTKDAIRMRDATPIQIVTSIFHCCCDILAACVILMVPISCLKVFFIEANKTIYLAGIWNPSYLSDDYSSSSAANFAIIRSIFIKCCSRNASFVRLFNRISLNKSE